MSTEWAANLAQVAQGEAAWPAKGGPDDGQLRAGQLDALGDAHVRQVAQQLIAHQPGAVDGAAKELARTPPPHARVQAVPQPDLSTSYSNVCQSHILSFDILTLWQSPSSQMCCISASKIPYVLPSLIAGITLYQDNERKSLCIACK